MHHQRRKDEPGARRVGEVDHRARQPLLELGARQVAAERPVWRVVRVQWQRRAGGTLQTLASNVASAAMKFDSAIARFPAYFARTISLVKAIEGLDDLVIMPPLPQVNMLHIYLPCTPERADAARDQIAAEFSLWLFNKANQGDSANSCYFELYIGEALMDISDPLAAHVFARLLAIIRAG